MADNFSTDTVAGGGPTFASDEISLVQFPRVKIVIGADGTNDGDVASGNPMPVDDAGGSLTVDNGGTFAVQVNGAALTALQLIDDPVVVDDAAFTPASTSVMMAGFEFDDVTPDSVNEGDAGAARMSANRNIYTNIRDAAGNERGVNVNASNQLSVSVDNSPTLGANSGVDVGDVTINNASGASAVNVQDGGNSITVDNAGTFATQVDGDALTALQVIDNPVVVDDAAFTPASTSVMMAGFEFDDTAPDSVNEGDAGAARMSANRNVYTTIRDAAGNERGVNVNASNQASVSVDNSPTLGANSGVDIGDVTVNNGSGGSAVNIQDGGNSITIDGTITADAGSGTFTIGNTNIDNLHSSDFDSGAGTDTTTSIGIAVAASGGAAVITGDTTNGLDVDVTRVGGVVSVDDNSGSLTVDNAALSVTGGGAEASALRVTIANNSTGTLSIDDGGGSITVDGTFTSNAEYAEDSAHSSGETGQLILGVRNDTGGTSVSADGDYEALQFDGSGRLRVVTQGGAGGTSSVDDTAFTVATDSGTPAMYLADDTAPDSVDEGDVGVPRMSLNRIPYSIIRDAAGNERGVNVNASNQMSVSVDASPSIFADDAAFTLASSSVNMAGAIRDDALSTLTAVEGDAVPFRVSSTGALHVTGGGGGTEYNEDDATPATIIGTATLMERDDALSTVTPIEADWIGLRGNARGALWVEVDSTNAVTVDGSAVTQPVSGTVTASNAAGDIAHDAADSGNPVKVGGVARTANPTAVADGDRVNLFCDDLGRAVTVPHAPRDRTVHNRITLTTTSETTLIAAGGASVFRDLVFLSMSNESATEVRVDIADSTAGTDRISIDLAADGGGAIIPFSVPLTQATANNNWTATLSGAVSSVYITAIAVEAN